MKKIFILLLLFSMIEIIPASSQVRLRTNLLGWATLIPNIGFEVGLSNRFTAVLDGQVSPMWAGDDFAFKGYWATPEIRYYFCESFNKHYIGLHGNLGHFSEWHMPNQHIRQDASVYAVGLTYGHQWIFNHHWSLDAFAGCGMWRVKGDVYSRCAPDVMIEKDGVQNSFGLTRLGVVFAYRF